MLTTVLINKLKSFVLCLVHVFRRALCCFRRKRRPSHGDSVQLTHVLTNLDGNELQNWTEWGDETSTKREPKTVQDHIDLYRSKTANKDEHPVETEAQLDFFEDMSPNITRQTKLLISKGRNERNSEKNRLDFTGEVNSIMPSSELGEWEESSGWEGENLQHDAQKVLREQKRLERERKLWEQQQKRMEKMHKSLGAKMNVS